MWNLINVKSDDAIAFLQQLKVWRIHIAVRKPSKHCKNSLFKTSTKISFSVAKKSK